MTDAVFQAPKRRARVYECFEAALPVPLNTADDDDDEDHIFICRAEIIGHHVSVTNPAHIQHLYHRGYFGKGVFSRSRPEHMISPQWKYVGDRCLPVISSSEYQQRISLARAALVMQDLEEESVNNALQILTEPVEFNTEEQQSQEPIIKSHCDGSLTDQTIDTDLIPGQTDSARPQRQENPLYDPLAEIYPEKLDQCLKEKCRKHDDWISQCGCRADEEQMSAKTQLSHTYEYFLVEESEDEHSEHFTQESGSIDQAGKLVCRINPFPMLEYLQLSYEEAFFLVYALGCLSIYYNEEPLSVAQLWTMFRSLQPNFCFSYTAYHYYRSKGWVPKSGVKYGTDFMLYRKGPPFYHASYSVVVDTVDECFSGSSLCPFSWRSLATLSRTTGNVSKELMLCFIITPSDVTEDLLFSPQCLKRFSVQEVLMSRWVSSKERTEQEEI